MTGSPLQLVPLPNGQFVQNCYLLFTADHPDAVLVDPGEETARFLAEAGRRGKRIAAIWLTHAHLDHILGVAEVRAATGAAVYLHPADRPLYDNLPEQSRWLGVAAGPPPRPDAELVHGQRLQVGNHPVEVRHVPGHSPGHVLFRTPAGVLCGDVIFAGSIGRTDLPGGDLDTLLASIRREVLTLPDDSVLHPGHGPSTTVGRERLHNPFLTGSA